MRKIEFTEIQTGQAMPYKSGTFEHLLQSVREITAKIPTASMPNLDTSPTLINVISGVESTAPNTYSAGAIMFDGYGMNSVTTLPSGTTNFNDPGFFTLDDSSPTGPEIFMVKASTGVVPSTPVWLVKGSFIGNTLNADPVTFSDATSHNVHSTWFIEITNSPSASPAYQIGTFADLIYAYQDVFTNHWIIYSLIDGPTGIVQNFQGQIDTINAAWTNRTITGDVTITGGSVVFHGATPYNLRYKQIGKTMFVNFYLDLTVTTSPTSITILLPGGVSSAAPVPISNPIKLVDGSGTSLFSSAIITTGTPTKIQLNWPGSLTAGTTVFTGSLTFDTI